MLLKNLLSVSTAAAFLTFIHACPQAQTQSSVSVSSATCCADCCDANGNSISPTLPAGVTATGSSNSVPTGTTCVATSSLATVPPSGTSNASTGNPTNTMPSQLPQSSSSVGSGNNTIGRGSNSSTSNANDTVSGNSTGSALSAPYFFLYSDLSVSGCLPDPSEIEGWNVFGLAFLLNSTEVYTDQAGCFAALDNSTRQSLLSKYHAAGIKVVASAFGQTETPTSKNEDPEQLASLFAAFVKDYQLDGIDVDYEDLDAMDNRNMSAENWLISFTQALRKELPQGQYLLSHAPVAPWFSDAYPDAYHTVDAQVGDLIDFYNVQFYNQNDYMTCDTLITQSGSQSANSALMQIIAQKIPANKLVIGKPGIVADATNGYVDPSILANCTAMARSQGWDGGMMSWEYPHANSAWIQTAWGGNSTS